MKFSPLFLTVNVYYNQYICLVNVYTTPKIKKDQTSLIFFGNRFSNDQFTATNDANRHRPHPKDFIFR